MNSQTVALMDITKNFNQSVSNNQSQNAKLRSKSLGLLKPRLEQQNLQTCMKESYKEVVMVNSHQASIVLVNKKSRHQVSTESITRQHQSKSKALCDLYKSKIQLSRIEEKTQSINKANQPMRLQLQLMSKSLMSFGVNQNGFISLDSEQKVNVYSQSNGQIKVMSNITNDFFTSKKVKIVNVFTFSYSTFFIDSLGILYGIGLNDKSQLGIGYTRQIVKKPQKILLPFQDKNNQTSIANNDSMNEEKVIKIVGGPFHSVILTNKHKVYYSGALYGQSEIMNNALIANFTQIKIKNERIKNIQCGLTSVIFHTMSDKIYIMGLFGDTNFYSSPNDLQFSLKSQIKQVKISNDCIYIITKTGELHKANMHKKLPIIAEIKFDQLVTLKSQTKKSDKIKVEVMFSSFSSVFFVIKCDSVSSNLSYYRYFVQRNQDQDEKSDIFTECILPVSLILPSQIFVASKQIYFLFTSDNRHILEKLQQEKLKKSQATQQMQAFLRRIKKLEEQNQKLKQVNDLLTKEVKNKPKKQYKSPISNINFNFEKQITPRTFTHDLEIQFSQIKLNKKIAQGGYGIIYKGQWKKTEVAVKIFKIDQNNTNSVKQFISECRAMQALRHPNIVMFLGACLKSPNFAIVLQYCEGGTLWSLLQNHKIDLSWKERLLLALQTAKAVNYLHDRKNPIIHRDLKSLNVLLDVNRKVKLADFGWTKCLQNYMTSKIGTYQWMAPQVLMGQQYSEKADVFSYSIILWEIAAREPPYRNINGIQVAYDVANKQFRPTIPINAPLDFKELIIRCWQKVPDRRPSFLEIIEDLQKQIRHLTSQCL